jgi:hypothetical protein
LNPGAVIVSPASGRASVGDGVVDWEIGVGDEANRSVNDGSGSSVVVGVYVAV